VNLLEISCKFFASSSKENFPQKCTKFLSIFRKTYFKTVHFLHHRFTVNFSIIFILFHFPHDEIFSCVPNWKRKIQYTFSFHQCLFCFYVVILLKKFCLSTSKQNILIDDEICDSFSELNFENFIKTCWIPHSALWPGNTL
jgi:hypothetical protein